MEESFNWLQRVIRSSITEFQFDCCVILVSLFHTKYHGDSLIEYYYGRLKEELKHLQHELSLTEV